MKIIDGKKKPREIKKTRQNKKQKQKKLKQKQKKKTKAKTAVKKGSKIKMEPRLKSIYKSEILPQLKDSLGVKNVMQVPRLEKIVINMGLGLDANDNKVLKTIETDLANIAGQKPVVTKSKKAISNFKTRAKIPLGLKVTLRKIICTFSLID